MYAMSTNRIKLSEISVYPNYHHLHVLNLILNPAVILTVMAIYYIRHPPLRKFLLREIKELLGIDLIAV
jgi:hypothetical protein